MVHAGFSPPSTKSVRSNRLVSWSVVASVSAARVWKPNAVASAGSKHGDVRLNLPGNSALVAAVIVAYYPDAQRIKALVDRLRSELLGTIYIVDNTPAEHGITFDTLVSGVEHMRLGSNTGIARAQNVGIEAALRAGHTHVMLFDQDSEPLPGMVAALLAVERAMIEAGHRVAAVGPSFRDRKSLVEAHAVRYRWWGVQKHKLSRGSQGVKTDSIIASGSLIRREVLLAVGGMIEALFIDWVDIEWSLRAKRMGYTCFIAPQLVMSHSVGDKAVRIVGRHFNLHSSFRQYYIVRNAFLMMRLGYLGVGARLGIFFKVLFKYVPAYLILSTHRIETLRMFGRALVDAFRIDRSILLPCRWDLDDSVR